MSAGASLADALGAAVGSAVARLEAVAGGDLNDAYAATLADGRRLFVKTSESAAPGAYAAEAEGLEWLAEAGELPLPRVVAVADTPQPDDCSVAAARAPVPAGPSAARPPRFLALEWIDAGPPSAATDEWLGRGLARLHAAGAPAFGGPRPALTIGPLTLPNGPSPDWPAFYAARRLVPLTRAAVDRGALPSGTAASLDRVVARLADLAGPPEPPARLHGDLWGGNVLTGRDGRPWLIDPAAHGGHREVDLAMLRLFGGPSERCFAAYAEVAPLAPGAADRVGLWQLAPLLLHAVLFGGGYGERVDAVARRYA